MASWGRASSLDLFTSSHASATRFGSPAQNGNPRLRIGWFSHPHPNRDAVWRPHCRRCCFGWLTDGSVLPPRLLLFEGVIGCKAAGSKVFLAQYAIVSSSAAARELRLIATHRNLLADRSLRCLQNTRCPWLSHNDQRPDAQARPVRPILWTYVSGTFGTS